MDLNYASDGSLASQSINNGDGSHEITGLQPNQILSSMGHDVMTGGGETRYRFGTPFGFDEITNFTAAGPGHDYLDLPAAHLSSFAAVMRHTTTALDGSAVIHLDRHDAIKLDGVTKADLLMNPHDIYFHA